MLRMAMAIFSKRFKQILSTVLLLLIIASLTAQEKKSAPVSAGNHWQGKKLKEFSKRVLQADAAFEYPDGFAEIPPPNNDDYSFDYALELPGKEFEIWLKVTPQKQEWLNYTRTQTAGGAATENPDSVYLDVGKAMAASLAGGQPYFERSIPPDILARYHADAGRSYLLTLLDRPETKHYKYALLITLQKNHAGTILAICFGNEKGPEFFKSISKASQCLKFKS